MCGWGAGGESGPRAGCGMGRCGGMSWGIRSRGRVSGKALAGQRVSLWHRAGGGVGWLVGGGGEFRAAARSSPGRLLTEGV